MEMGGARHAPDRMNGRIVASEERVLSLAESIHMLQASGGRVYGREMRPSAGKKNKRDRQQHRSVVQL